MCCSTRMAVNQGGPGTQADQPDPLGRMSELFAQVTPPTSFSCATKQTSLCWWVISQEAGVWQLNFSLDYSTFWETLEHPSVLGLPQSPFFLACCFLGLVLLSLTPQTCPCAQGETSHNLLPTWNKQSSYVKVWPCVTVVLITLGPLCRLAVYGRCLSNV